ncbi:hypothetical protein Y717_03900 [Streptomyces scopuliridis RB72]|uniref:Uncharacterized protein n=1 Tax=Streptomyces scopuliridis RB72 TaxID=1440053 RepID=A0A2T7TFH3_9ACTN|nr:hypothetical protein Y717_03900 [Streptomyces scopuliridis RB72]
MSLPQGRADQLATRLSAAGFSPRVTDHDDHTRIEMEVADSVSAGSWQELLAVLEAADRFGLDVSSAGGRLAWAAIRRNAPVTDDAVRGRTHQL